MPVPVAAAVVPFLSRALLTLLASRIIRIGFVSVVSFFLASTGVTGYMQGLQALLGFTNVIPQNVLNLIWVVLPIQAINVCINLLIGTFILKAVFRAYTAFS